MRDITQPALLYVKAALFVLIGVIAGALLIIRSPSLSTAILIALCVWAFARAYYFAFYVIEHYADRSFRYSGLWSLVVHMFSRRS